MGLTKIIGIVQGAVQLAGFAASLFRGPEGAKEEKPTFNEVLPDATANVMKAVQTAINYGQITTEEKLESWLKLADERLGSEVTAIDIIPSLPPDKEEELSDHLIAAARIYGKSLLNVPGYNVNAPAA